MNMEFQRKLPIPKDIKEQFPLSAEGEKALKAQQEEINNIFSGKSDKFALVIGPCSADREDAVLDYIYRLRGVQEKVKDKIVIIPRIYTNKPRTTGEGYKGGLAANGAKSWRPTKRRAASCIAPTSSRLCMNAQYGARQGGNMSAL